MRRLIVFLLILAMAFPVYAGIDLINPEDEFITNSSTVTFDYRPDIGDVLSCTIHAGPHDFPDLDPNNGGISTVTVQNIDEGTHLWNVTCTNLSSTVSSPYRTFTVDTTPPTLDLQEPQEGGTYEGLSVRFVPQDTSGEDLTCTITWGGLLVEQVTVASATTFEKEYSVTPGSGDFAVTCRDHAVNGVREEIGIDVEQQLFLSLDLEDTTYGITDEVELTIDTVSGADVTLDICPNEQGFVQCSTALFDTNQFPQTIILPYMNKTGEYLVEGIASFNGQTRINQTSYTLENTIVTDLTRDGEKTLNSPILFAVNPTGGISPYDVEWHLSNGTTLTGVSSVEMMYTSPGNRTERVTVTDAAGNTREDSLEIELKREYQIVLFVQEEGTNLPIKHADVDIDGQTKQTLVEGKVLYNLTGGSHRLFISAAGFEYYLLEFDVTKAETLIATLKKNALFPGVEIISPLANEAVPSPTRIQFKTTNFGAAECTLYFLSEGSWFVENGSMSITKDGTYEFTRNRVEGSHEAQVECITPANVAKTSPAVAFTVGNTAPVQTTAETPAVEPSSEFFSKELEILALILEDVEGYGPKEQAIMEIIRFGESIRNTRRALQQAARDLETIQFRTDLDDAGKQRERENIIEKVNSLYANTPVVMEILKKRTFIKYVEEEDMDSIVSALTSAGAIEGDEKSLKKRIIEDQQKFTISTELYHIEYTYPGTDTEVVTLVVRSFTYADDISDEYKIIEIIPKEIVDDAEDLTIYGKVEILEKDPILQFDAEERIVYSIPKKVDFTKMELVSTLIARRYVAEETMITGFAFLPGVDLGSWGLPGIIILVVLLVAWLIYYFDVFQQMKYIIYKFGKNEQVHYLRVLMSDAEDHLTAGSYDKADMLYKEIRLTYDTLSGLARNELYQDVMDLVRQMDVYYFNMIMIEMDNHLKAGNYEDAIHSYEKLTGTFERLDEERQQVLVERVKQMARRLGVGS